MKKMKDLFLSIFCVRDKAATFVKLLAITLIVATLFSTLAVADQAWKQIVVEQLTQKVLSSNPNRPQYPNYVTEFLKSDGRHRIKRDGTVIDYLDSENFLATVLGLNIAAKSYSISDTGSVTQTTSITTGVTLNKISGQITTVSSTLAAGAEASFVVTNSTVTANSVIVAHLASTSSAGTPIVAVTAVGSGSFTLTISNLHASAALDNSLTISFAVFGVNPGE